MFFWNTICGFIALFLSCCSTSLAQTSVHFTNSYNSYHGLHIATPDTCMQSALPKNLSSLLQMKPPVAENFITSNYSFFCREELKIEKATKIPVRFRLGSLEQCNYYEGKKQ